jgi:hypothetical protein
MPPIEQYPAWRDGVFLVLPRGSPVAPNRCILTNQAVHEEAKTSRHLSWGDEGPIKWLPQKIRILLALSNMKYFTVTFGLSADAKVRRLYGLVVAAVSFTFGFYLFEQGFRVDGAPVSIGVVGGGAVMIVVSLVLFANSYYTFDIAAVSAHYIWLRGAKQPFLDSLPPLPSTQESNSEQDTVSPVRASGSRENRSRNR